MRLQAAGIDLDIALGNRDTDIPAELPEGVEFEGGILLLSSLKLSPGASRASESASVGSESMGRIGASGVGSWGLAGIEFSSGIGFWVVFWSSGGINRLYQNINFYLRLKITKLKRGLIAVLI